MLPNLIDFILTYNIYLKISLFFNSQLPFNRVISKQKLCSSRQAGDCRTSGALQENLASVICCAVQFLSCSSKTSAVYPPECSVLGIAAKIATGHSKPVPDVCTGLLKGVSAFQVRHWQDFESQSPCSSTAVASAACQGDNCRLKTSAPEKEQLIMIEPAAAEGPTSWATFWTRRQEAQSSQTRRGPVPTSVIVLVTTTFTEHRACIDISIAQKALDHFW